MGTVVGVFPRVQGGGSMADETIMRICVAETYLFTVAKSNALGIPNDFGGLGGLSLSDRHYSPTINLHRKGVEKHIRL